MVTASLLARTEGYFPHELSSGNFSDKSDVYSYGVIRYQQYFIMKLMVLCLEEPKIKDRHPVSL